VSAGEKKRECEWVVNIVVVAER